VAPAAVNATKSLNLQGRERLIKILKQNQLNQLFTTSWDQCSSAWRHKAPGKPNEEICFWWWTRYQF